MKEFASNSGIISEVLTLYFSRISSKYYPDIIEKPFNRCRDLIPILVRRRKYIKEGLLKLWSPYSVIMK